MNENLVEDDDFDLRNLIFFSSVIILFLNLRFKLVSTRELKHIKKNESP